MPDITPRQAGEALPKVEVTKEMLDAAMRRLQAYDRAWEYVDREMMHEILCAALSGIERTT